MLTLSEFKETGTRHSVADACDIIGIDPSYYDGTDVVAVWVYSDSLHMDERAGGKFHLLIERSEWEGTRDEMAETLYFEWYVSECVAPDEWDESKMVALYESWLAWTGYTPASADELSADIAADNPPESRTVKAANHLLWLGWFIELWTDFESGKL